MARSLVKSWDNRNQCRKGMRYAGWTRRMRWYEDSDIRICYEDQDGEQNLIYNFIEDAQKDWDDFKKGILTTLELRKRITE